MSTAAAPPVTVDTLSINSEVVTLLGALYCPFFGLDEAAACTAENYAFINFNSVGVGVTAFMLKLQGITHSSSLKRVESSWIISEMTTLRCFLTLPNKDSV